MGKNNPRVYIEVNIGNRAGGKIFFELYRDVTPKTVDNFLALIKGTVGIGQHTKKKMCYSGTKVFRVDQGVCLAMGDIENKDGEGGESIYGPTFKDENYVRRHTQAGVLSMWTPKGRHTNASSFSITLKACRPFDGRRVAFGQVIGGMDVVRAIEKVPCEGIGNFKPRVDIRIVSCGEADATELAALMVQPAAEARPGATYGRNRPMEIRESTKALTILEGETTKEKEERERKGKEEDPMAIDCEPASSSSKAPEAQAKDIAMALSAASEEPRKFNSDVERRIYELRLKMNKGRQANTTAVLEEKRRNEDPDYEKKKAAKEWKERQERKAEREAKMEETGEAAIGVPKGKEYLADPAEKIGKMMKKDEAKEKSKAIFGWDVFNQDSLMRSHDKQVAKIGEVQNEDYEEQKKKLGQAFYEGHTSINGLGFKATEEAKDKVAEYMEDAAKRKAKFSRRRAVYEGEDISGINGQNQHYNKKIQRAFGEYADEIKQNLERGTAL